MSSGIPTTCKHGEDVTICELCWIKLNEELEWENGMTLGIEQDRRDLKQCFPELYAYIELFVSAQALDRAGDHMSAKGEYGAANMLWSWSGSFDTTRKQMFQGEQDGNSEPVTCTLTP